MTRGDYSLTQRAQRGEAATKKGWPSLNAEGAEGLERGAEGWIFGGVQNLRKARTFFGFALQRRGGRRGFIPGTLGRFLGHCTAGFISIAHVRAAEEENEGRCHNAAEP